MSDESEENTDYSQVIDDIFLAENVAEEAAYEKGYVIGQNQMVEGFHYGYHTASSLSAQLGYYFGVLTYIKKTIDIPKIIDLSIKLITEIQNFPIDNNDSIEIFEEFEKIKLSFKKICSLAKIDATYPDTNKLDF